MLADAGPRHLGIEHKVVSDVVKDRSAYQRWSARLFPEGRRQRLPGRKTKGRAIDGEQPESVPQGC